jgi:prophage tail gpP-like protein
MSIPPTVAISRLATGSALQTNGQLSPISILVRPVDPNRSAFEFPALINNGAFQGSFRSYEFDSSVVIPVDAFQFNFVAPETENIYDMIKDGDIAVLKYKNVVLATCMVDSVELDVDAYNGELVTIHGRNLMGQLEDQALINTIDQPIFVKTGSVQSIIQTICGLDSNPRTTRIQGINLKNVPPGSTYQFCAEPGESKLSAMLRFLEALNCLVWMDPFGNINVGKPNFNDYSGSLYAIKETKRSNVLSYRVVRNSTSIPTSVTAIYSGQEKIPGYVTTNQRLNNNADRPSQLRSDSFFVPKVVVASFINGFDPAFINFLNSTKSTGLTLMQNLAARDIARENMREVLIDVEVVGHANNLGNPYRVDTCYSLTFDRASIEGDLYYCYSVKYKLSEQFGITTTLSFCNLNTIVADAPLGLGPAL